MGYLNYRLLQQRQELKWIIPYGVQPCRRGQVDEEPGQLQDVQRGNGWLLVQGGGVRGI